MTYNAVCVQATLTGSFHPMTQARKGHETNLNNLSCDSPTRDTPALGELSDES